MGHPVRTRSKKMRVEGLPARYTEAPRPNPSWGPMSWVRDYMTKQELNLGAKSLNVAAVTDLWLSDPALYALNKTTTPDRWMASQPRTVTFE